MRKLQLGSFLFSSIVLISCSNPVDERNAIMTEFINRDKVIQFQLDSMDKQMDKFSFLDTFGFINVPAGIEKKRKVDEDYRSELIGKIVKLKKEMKSLKFSIDSISKMK